MPMDCIYVFLFEYDESDIKPNAIVIELNHIQVEWKYIYDGVIIILQDLSELSYLFECLIAIDFECEPTYMDTYIHEIINKNKSFRLSLSGDHDDIMTKYFNWQRKRIENAGDDFDMLSEILDDYGPVGLVGDFCYLQEYVKIDSFEFWFMGHIYDDDDNNYYNEENFDTNSLFKSSEQKEMIANTINKVNHIDEFYS